MKFSTKHFGEIEIDESKKITFEEGIPGFFHCRDFILLEENSNLEEGTGLFWWLQSLDDGDIAFVLINVFAFMPEYTPLIDPLDIADLGEYIEEDFVVYNIAVVPETITELSVNLKAPIIINTLNRRGKQVIASNEEYNVRHHIFQELKKKL